MKWKFLICRLALVTFFLQVKKFDGEFTLKGRFDSGKSRAHYVLLPLRKR